MVWLHSWVGLTAGWILYFVFLTGTTGYLHFEISRWMRPELPLISAPPPMAETLASAERFLSENARDSEFWMISLPGHRGTEQLTVSWRWRGDTVHAILDSRTGERVERRARETGGGTSLYVMHYALHYLSRDFAILVVGAAAMTMLVSLLTGIVSHKKILSELLTFRPGRGAANWRSGHTLLGATALPFHLMMTWSGLVIFLFLYMPVAQQALFPNDDAMMRFNEDAFVQKQSPPEWEGARPATLTSLPEVLARAETSWGNGSVLGLRVENPGRADARVIAHSRRAAIGGEKRLTFDAVTGTPREEGAPRTGAGKFYATMIGLHEGHFAWSYLRILYVVCGFAGTALMGTGLVLWSVKRKSMRSEGAGRQLGVAVVDVLNLGTIIGLPVGMAAYFWANRLLPLHIESRGAWEVHIMFMTWAAMYLCALVRPHGRAWAEMCALCAAMYGFIPVLNALTTDRHLGVTIPAGDWVLAGFDLFALAAAAFFAALARMSWRKRSINADAPSRDETQYSRTGTV
jgi:uncharacterized iron-regulated membrane protein